MTGEVIKSFLVGLGFSVNDSDLAKFNKALASATVKVTALYGAINLMAAGIVKSVSGISEEFEKMGYEYHIIAPAINKALVLRQELLKAYSAAGINITKVIQNSVNLNMSLTKTKYALEAIYKSVGSRFFTLLTKQSDAFRKSLYANMPKIQNALERFVKFIFKAFEAVTTLATRLWSMLTRVYDFFVQLDKATDGWSTIILGVIAAWQLLNLEFLATPLGMLLTGFVALLALFDDFKTWQEGGKSLFDWSKALPAINAAIAIFQNLKKTLEGVFDVLGDIVASIIHLFTLDFSGFVDSIKSAFDNVIKVFSTAMGAIKGFTGLAGAAGDAIGGLFGDKPANAAANVRQLNGQAAPIGSAAQNSQVNQNVRAQTTIHVQGSADANAMGKAVGNEQGRVNQDMVRNMKGTTR